MKEIGNIFVNVDHVMYCQIISNPKGSNADQCYIQIHFKGGGYYNIDENYPNKPCAKSAILSLTK
jgi:hypothetical protein